GALRQTDRPGASGRAHLEAVSLHGAQLGALGAQVRESARQPRHEPDRAGQAEPRDAGAAPRERGVERVLDLRSRPFFLRGPQLRGTAPAADAEGGWALARGRLAGGPRARRSKPLGNPL